MPLDTLHNRMRARRGGTCASAFSEELQGISGLRVEVTSRSVHKGWHSCRSLDQRGNVATHGLLSACAGPACRCKPKQQRLRQSGVPSIRESHPKACCIIRLPAARPELAAWVSSGAQRRAAMATRCTRREPAAVLTTAATTAPTRDRGTPGGERVGDAAAQARHVAHSALQLHAPRLAGRQRRRQPRGVRVLAQYRPARR